MEDKENGCENNKTRPRSDAAVSLKELTTKYTSNTSNNNYNKHEVKSSERPPKKLVAIASKADVSDTNSNNKRPLEEVSEGSRKRQATSKVWERTFQALKAFKEKHGHCNVAYRCNEEPTLGTWVARQRKNRNELSQEQRDRLDALGFQWESTQERSWKEKFERLKAFWNKHGHSSVPTSYAEDPELGEWTAKQRQKFTQGRLSEDRQKLLDSVGFVYRINKFIKRKSTAREDKKWFEQLERLIFFLLEHGHTLVPFAYKAEKSLGRWVNEQRCQKMRGLLRDDRCEILGQIGFVWKVSSRKGELPQPEDEQALFRYRFRELVEHKKEYGIFPACQHGEVGKWAAEQKLLMEAGKLEETKAQRFAAIGFCNAGDAQIWDVNYEKLRQKGYNSIFTLEDPKLSHWIICQRYLFKKGMLSTERKLRFYDIPGFVWDSSPINLPQPEPKHAMKEKTKNRTMAKQAAKKKDPQEDPEATSSESEDDEGVETNKGNFVRLLAIASEWKGEAEKQTSNT